MSISQVNLKLCKFQLSANVRCISSDESVFQSIDLLMAAKDDDRWVALSQLKEYKHCVIDDRTSLSGAQIDMMVLTGLMTFVSAKGSLYVC